MMRLGHRTGLLWTAALVHRLSGLALAIFLPLHFLTLGLAINIGRLVLEAAPRVQAEDQSVIRLARAFIDTIMVQINETPDPQASKDAYDTLRVINIAGDGSVDEAIRDVIWEADMCFTKPDMGQSMPWTLHGKVICMASDSSSVSAFMRTVACPSLVTLTRQSTRFSPPAGTFSL